MICVKNEDDLNCSEEMIECPDVRLLFLKTNLNFTWSKIKMDNIDKEVFDGLPTDLKIELLTDYKEKLKRNKGAQFESFPEVISFYKYFKYY